MRRRRVAAAFLAAVSGLVLLVGPASAANYTGNWDISMQLENGTWTWPAFVKEVIDTGSRISIPGDFEVPRTGPDTAEGWPWGDDYDGEYFVWTLGDNQMDIYDTRYWRGTEIVEKAMNIRCTPTAMADDGTFSVLAGSTYDGTSVSLNATGNVFASRDVYADGIMIEIADGVDYVRFMLMPASYIETSFPKTYSVPGEAMMMPDWEHDGQWLNEDLLPTTSTVYIGDFSAGRLVGSFDLFFTGGGNLTGSFDVPYQANGAVPIGDMNESNDTQPLATWIIVDGVPQYNTIHSPTDIDWFRFTATMSGMHYVRVTSSSKDGFGDDDGLNVALYDGGSPLLDSNTQGDPIAWDLIMGYTYYVEVYFDSPYGFYEIEVSTDPGVVADGFEPGDNFTGTFLPMGANAVRHTIHDPLDVDWYEVDLSSTSATYVFETEAGLDPTLVLWDSTVASQVASSDWGELTFSVGAYPLGPYYLQVYGTPTWYYIAARGVEPDSYETADDDYALMSNPIVIDGGIQSHTIHANGNQDWMWFTAVFGQTYHIETSNHSGMELHLCLYDAAGVPSMSSIRDQDSRDEVSMVMKWTADGEGTYYIMVESFGSLGDYDIEIRTAPAIVSVIADDPDDGDTAYGIGDTITITFDMDTNQPPYGTNPGAWMDLNFDLGAGETFGDTADGFTLTWTDPRTLVITVNGVSSSTLSLGDTITVLSAAGLTSATGTVTCTDTSPPIVGDWGIFSIYITVTSPNGGETWMPDSSQTITWISAGVSAVDISYSTDGGASWNDIQLDVTATAGSWPWTVPTTESTTYLIHIEEFGTVSDDSDGYFTVSSTVPQARLEVDRTSVSFTAEQGGPNPPSQDITISNTGDPGTTLDWTTTISYGAGSGWLTCSPIVGSIGSGSFDYVTVTADPAAAGLTEGTYTATIVVEGWDAASAEPALDSPLDVNVTLTVTSPPPFTDTGDRFYSAYFGDVAWGDYDADGGLDFVVATYDWGDIRLYGNDGGGMFSEFGASFQGGNMSSLAWGDYDSDGDLDLAFAGGGYAFVYQNDGLGWFTDTGQQLTGVWYASVAWGDYDNDGDLDLALSGSLNGPSLTDQPVTKIYRNDEGTFFDIGAPIILGLFKGELAWGDYDSDGDLDLAICGTTDDTSSGAKTKLYRNDAGVFNDSGISLTGVWDASLAWGDYDSDGFLDLAVAGRGVTGPVAGVYHNDGGSGISVGAVLTGAENASVAWGDYDNDGDLDLVLCGTTDGSPSGAFTKVYRNDVGAFFDINAGMTGFHVGSAAWGDYDNDGDLDLLVGGEDEYYSHYTKIYRNDAGVFNSSPSAPSAPSFAVVGSSVMLSWGPGSDGAQTPQAGLTYNLRVGTMSGWDDVVSGMADQSSGGRFVPAMGNVQNNTTWILKNLPAGDYWWSVQTVDSGFRSSSWSAEIMSTVGGTLQPDLVIVSVVPSDPNPAVGSTIDVNVTVRNQGDADATGFDVALFWDCDPAPAVGDPSFNDMQPAGTLAAGAETVLFFSPVPPPTSGTWHMYAVADATLPSGVVTEYDETNNVFGPVAVNWVSPEITVNPTSLQFEAWQGGINPGSQYFEIRNTGDPGSMLNWTISITYGGPEVPWLSTDYVSGICASGEYYWVGAWVDHQAAGLLQNTYNATITVTAPDAPNSPQTIPVTLTLHEEDITAPVISSVWPEGALEVDSYIIIYVSGSDTQCANLTGWVDIYSPSTGQSGWCDLMDEGGGQYRADWYTYGWPVADDYDIQVTLRDGAGNEGYGGMPPVELTPWTPKPDIDMLGSSSAPGEALFAREGYDLSFTMNASFSEYAGLEVSSPFEVGAYLSTDTSIDRFSDTFLGSGSVSYLSAYEYRDLDFPVTVPAGTAAGTYYVGCYADRTDVITEGNENNNAANWYGVVRVDILPQPLSESQVDLTVGNAGFSTPGQIVLDAFFNCYVEVQSLGATPAGTFRVGVYFSDDGVIDGVNDYLMGFVDVASIQDISDMLFVPCQASGADLLVGTTYTWGVVVDDQNVIGEVNEVNNTYQGWQMTVVDSVPANRQFDLVAEGAYGPPVLVMEEGVPYNVTYSVRLDGNVDVGPFMVRFYLSSDATIDATDAEIGSVQVANMPVGYSDYSSPDWVQITTPADMVGTYYFGFIVDADDQVTPETDETNNVYVMEGVPVQVIAAGAGGPDLLAVPTEPGESPSGSIPRYTVEFGGTVTWPSLTVANLGTQGAGAGVPVTFYASTDQAVDTGDYALGTYSCDVLPAGMYYEINDQVTLDVSALSVGSYWLYTYIDPDDTVVEISETNNSSVDLVVGDENIGTWMELIVTDAGNAQPDLWASLDVDDDGYYLPSGPITPQFWYRASVANGSLSAGTEAAPSVVTFWLSMNSDPSIGPDDTYLGAEAVGFLQPASDVTFDSGGQQLTIWPMMLADYYLKAVVDALDEVLGEDKSNNVAVSAKFFFYDDNSMPLTFTDIGAGLTGVEYASLAWGDYDNDGDLDLAVAGSDQVTRPTRIYRNDGGTFTDIGAGLVQVYQCSLAWGDYDNDGDLDLTVAGDGPVHKVYRNDAGTFTDIATLADIKVCSLAWGDYDNDGDLDLATAGTTDGTAAGSVTVVYSNDGGVFSDIGAGLTGVNGASLAWGDYDNDGDLDLAVAGIDSGDIPVSKIYRNDGGIFTDIGAGLTGVNTGSLAWGDYDNDGDLDLALAGSSSSGSVSKVYSNDGGVFTDILAGLTGVYTCSLAWGDYDNDGDLDLALAGRDGSGAVSKIYRNDGVTFVDIGAGLTGVDNCSLAWGDYDNDGNLDLAVAGKTGAGPITKIYRLDGGQPNSQPWSPGNLEAGDFLLVTLSGDVQFTYESDAVSGTGTAFMTEVSTGDFIRPQWSDRWLEVARVTDDRNLLLVNPSDNDWYGTALAKNVDETDAVTFIWDGAGDNETPWGGLSYNLRVGTMPGMDDVFSGMADPLMGRRRIPAMGNAQHNRSWTLHGLAGGTYYWSVQVIDTGFAASGWSNERSIAVGLAPDLVVTVVPADPDPYVGETISVHVLVQNVGTVAAGQFDVSLFYDRWKPSVDEPGDDMLPVPSLAAGASAPLQFTNVSQATGYGGSVWSMYAAVDTMRQVVESDESNNVIGPVQITWHGPDIVIDSMEVSDPSPFAGDYVSVTLTVRNQGDAAAGQFEVGLFYGAMWPPMPGDPADDFQTVFGLAPDETRTIKFTGITSSTVGGREIYAIVDNALPPGSVVEADENNNNSQVWVEWQKPFLFSISSSSTSFQAVAGAVGVLTKTVTVSHRRSVGNPVQVSIETDPPEGIDYVTVTPTSFSLPPGGSRTVYVQLDPSDIDPTRSMSLRSVGQVRVTDANSLDELTVDVRVGIEPGLAGFDFALNLGCTPANHAGAAAALALCVLAACLMLRRVVRTSVGPACAAEAATARRRPDLPGRRRAASARERAG